MPQPHHTFAVAEEVVVLDAVGVTADEDGIDITGSANPLELDGLRPGRLHVFLCGDDKADRQERQHAHRAQQDAEEGKQRNSGGLRLPPHERDGSSAAAGIESVTSGAAVASSVEVGISGGGVSGVGWLSRPALKSRSTGCSAAT